MLKRVGVVECPTRDNGLSCPATTTTTVITTHSHNGNVTTTQTTTMTQPTQCTTTGGFFGCMFYPSLCKDTRPLNVWCANCRNRYLFPECYNSMFGNRCIR